MSFRPSDPGARYRRLVEFRSGSLRCPDDSGGATCRFNQGLMSVCPLDSIANAHLALDDFKNFALARQGADLR